MMKFRSVFLAASALFATAAAFAQVQGVTKDEIVLGTQNDLSGPAVFIGKFTRNRLQMRGEEMNETGGINGRRIRLIVADYADFK
jgi:branched-chain amino acid transport system substrate-binding protein